MLHHYPAFKLSELILLVFGEMGFDWHFDFFKNYSEKLGKQWLDLACLTRIQLC